jgi:hypothetical protein
MAYSGERSTQRQTPEFERRVPEFNILAQQRSRGDGLDQKEKSIKMSISSTSFLCVISRHVELTTCAHKRCMEFPLQLCSCRSKMLIMTVWGLSEVVSYRLSQGVSSSVQLWMIGCGFGGEILDWTMTVGKFKMKFQ